ncbi:MAG: TadE/TadG family type IV pilus assembly protein [Acidimicrobiales bacterium]
MKPSQCRQLDRGAVLVEFALVLPIFALMLFAMVQFGVLFAGWAQLRNAVQTTARLASMGQQSPQCGPLSLPDCTAAFLIGTPVGLVAGPSQPVTSAYINKPDQAQCTVPLTKCSDASWLDGYYIQLAGTWKQIVSAASHPSAGQVTDQTALHAVTSGTWQCAAGDPSGYCSAISTLATSADGGPALGNDFNDIAVWCTSCGTGGQVFVCTSFASAQLTSLLPRITVSTQSAFYIETGTVTPMDQGGIPCG